VPKSPSVPHQILPADTHCNAWISARKCYCKQHAGHRTPHQGTGRCWLHGGCASVARITHGRYSTLKTVRLQELVRQYEADPDPLSMLSELALARAVLVDYLERYRENNAALLAWHESWRVQSADLHGTEGNGAVATVPQHATKPLKVLDISDVYKQVEAITRICERIERLRMDNAISRPELLRILGAMARGVEMYVLDPHVLEQIKQSWGEIRV
jgi:hypothetical protein